METVATGLEAPWEIAFLPDGRALVTERPGRVRLLERDLTPAAGAGRRESRWRRSARAACSGRRSTRGSERNGLVYLYRTTNEGNEVVRYRFEGDGLEDETVIADGIAAGAIHDGGRIHFGPDGRLYFSTGDAGQDDLAQDPQSLNGKILRLAPGQYRGAGGRPEVFSLGPPQPSGLRLAARTAAWSATEHGPDGDDEVNVIREGANYGWPLVRGEDHGDFVASGGRLPGLDRTVGRQLREPARLGVDGRLPVRRPGRRADPPPALRRLRTGGARRGPVRGRVRPACGRSSRAPTARSTRSRATATAAAARAAKTTACSGSSAAG